MLQFPQADRGGSNGLDLLIKAAEVHKCRTSFSFSFVYFVATFQIRQGGSHSQREANPLLRCSVESWLWTLSTLRDNGRYVGVSAHERFVA